MESNQESDRSLDEFNTIESFMMKMANSSTGAALGAKIPRKPRQCWSLCRLCWYRHYSDANGQQQAKR